GECQPGYHCLGWRFAGWHLSVHHGFQSFYLSCRSRSPGLLSETRHRKGIGSFDSDSERTGNQCSAPGSPGSGGVLPADWLHTRAAALALEGGETLTLRQKWVGAPGFNPATSGKKTK